MGSGSNALEVLDVRRREKRSMTNVLIPVTPDAGAPPEDATAGCGCCVPPPDAAQAEGRRLALAELQARRDALERRLRNLG